jgi:DNA-directed RNA polymerase III subunit RPC4
VQFGRCGADALQVTGGSQAAFLQQLMVLDASSATATTLGELHRKFVVAPDVEEMLRDAAIGDREARERREREGMDELE